MKYIGEIVDVLQTIVYGIGFVIATWGAINYLEGHANESPGSKSQGLKQFTAGIGIWLIANRIIPLIKNFFN